MLVKLDNSSFFVISKEWVDTAVGEATSGADPTYIALKGVLNFLLFPIYQSQHALQHVFIALRRWRYLGVYFL